MSSATRSRTLNTLAAKP
ncbi:hypothetical protein GQ600_3742 [Phytophthora cactorum]|nr:hypothetical protein GQ600_3742 [Phytophthora cactorum]